MPSNDRTRASYYAMMTLCYNPRASHWEYYGGRGITVCERWHVYANFLADMGDRPEGKTLDRFPDTNGNYCLGNVRWATPIEQANNQRGNRVLTCDGMTMSLAMWARHLGITASSLADRIDRGGNRELGRTWL